MKNYSCFIILVFFCLRLVTGQEVAPEQLIDDVFAEDYANENANEPYPTPTPEQRGDIFYQQRDFDANFKNKYQGEKFDYDRITKPQKPPPTPSFSIPSGLLNVLMYVILGTIIILVLYQIFKNAGGFSFGRESKKIKFDTSTETDLEDEENIENNDFQRLIEKAKKDKDYRRAIRYYYLWVLQQLADKQFIKWNRDKTDSDYLVELKENPIKKDFSVSNYIYDNIWYGNFHLTDVEFGLAETIFQQTLRKLR